jgi:integrase
MTLTNTQCQNAKTKDKPYKLADGGGLYLLVHPNGSKYWRLKYRIAGKEKLMALGVHPLMTLAEAREARNNAKKLLASDMDPMAHKKETRRKTRDNAQNTFEIVAREWYENQLERWTQDYADNIKHRLEVDIFPHIGSRPISEITPPELLECLRKIEKRGALETAGRVKQTCGQVFRYGIQTGKCDRDAAADLKGALKSRKVQHYATIDSKEIPDFIRALENNDARLYARTRRAIWLSMLTFTRPGEIRQARWSEIDLEAKEWIIPAERIKMRKDHVVPLSRQTLAIMKEQKEETGVLNTDYVFPSQIKPRQPMSDGTVNRALKRLGYGQNMVAHGFRALARTTIREKLGYDSEIIEKQLAHRTRNPLGEAYDRTQFLDKRRKMMQHWADYLDAVANGTNVVKARFGGK